MLVSSLIERPVVHSPSHPARFVHRQRASRVGPVVRLGSRNVIRRSRAETRSGSC